MRNRAFTLVELLAVIGILGLLISLLLPTVTRAARRGRRIPCMNNLRQMAMAMHLYAGQHQGRLPCTREPGPGPGQKAPWLGSEVHWGDVPGALVPFLGGTNAVRRLARCPALPAGKLFSGIGSNGFFDYSSNEGWGGFKLAVAPTTARLIYDGRTEVYPTPLIVEEDPFFYINLDNVDPFHGNVDRIGSWHDGNGHYAAVDASVHTLKITLRDSAKNLLGPTARNWYVRTPRGLEVSLGEYIYGPFGF